MNGHLKAIFDPYIWEYATYTRPFHNPVIQLKIQHILFQSQKFLQSSLTKLLLDIFVLHTI